MIKKREVELYYTAPDDEVFEEVKQQAIALWSGMGDEPSYSNEKVERIKDLINIQDNVMYMVAMFDQGNQSKLARSLSEKSRQAIRERLIDGGSPDYSIMF